LIERLNLMRAIRKLPSGYKQIFLMHDVIGYEHGEIADSRREVLADVFVEELNRNMLMAPLA